MNIPGIFSKVGKPPESNVHPPDDMVTNLRVVPLGGRVSTDKSETLPFQLLVERGGKGGNKRDSRYMDLEIKNIKRMEPKQLYEILVDSDPEVSLGLFHFLCFSNYSFSLKAYQPGTDTPHDEAQSVLDEFMSLMELEYGGLDVQLSRVFYGLFLGGAAFMEIVLDEAGRNIVDFVPIDPYEARFEKREVPGRGSKWRLGQIINGEFVELAGYDTVRYMPFHPAVGSPYGRALMSPTVFPSLFLISILRDLERVIRHQGWQRLNIELDLEKMGLGDYFRSDANKKIITDMIKEVEEEYKKLEPDDVFTHTSHITFGKAVGSNERFGFSGLAEIIMILERRIIRALKSQPLLMGSNEAVTETHAVKQWEIYGVSIMSVTGLVSRSVAHLLGVALQARAILADVVLEFDQFRDAERIRQAQADHQELTNVKLQQDEQWISREEAQEIAREKQGLKGSGPAFDPNFVVLPQPSPAASSGNSD